MASYSARVSIVTVGDVTTGGKRRRRKKRRGFRDILSVRGVRRIVLSELAQKIIGCVAGENITSENPWLMIKKETIQDNIELHEDSSEFLPIRHEIMEYPKEDILIGYIPDDSKEYDEFFVCCTVDALNTVNDIIQKIKAEQEERLHNAINKTVKKWQSHGSEVEVEEVMVKNTRPLLEVEVESEYPIFAAEPDFKVTKAEDMRDGYMELRCVDEHIANVYRKRIDNQTQVAPAIITREAQTTCAYPSNNATQYMYEIENAEELFKVCEDDIKKYAEENLQNISETLEVNGVINLYSDDYNSLVNDPKFSKAMAVEEVKEYMSFMDVDLCKGKMIADAVWHPMWSGTVAVAYADAAPSICNVGPNQEDIVMRAVHGVNPVLIWSCVDVLKPKLILETPREVHKLSFCRFNENILVGGCVNGQIILWDIRNKLNKVEELEVLTNAQQKYRAYMNSLMGWMKNIHDISVIRPTVLSDVVNCHNGPVTGISWVSPHYEFSKLGVLSEVPEDDNGQPILSMQFLTGSEDGTVCIWDLQKKPAISQMGYKPRKLRRLKKRPSALLAEVSPYRILHLNLRPIYRIYLSKRDSKNRLGISSCYGEHIYVRYAEANPVRGKQKQKKRKMHERVIYRPIVEKREGWSPENQIHCGTLEGDYVSLSWDGKDFDSGEVVSSEFGINASMAKCHDGPVNTTHTSEKTGVTLTVGGKVFALWTKDLPDRPLLWRRNKRNMFTTGEWDIFNPYRLIVKIMNGDVESWTVADNSKEPAFHLTFSSGYLTSSAIHPLPLKKEIYGAGDKQGVYRLFIIPDDTSESRGDKLEHFKKFIDREVSRKRKFLEWQKAWNKKNESFLMERQEQDRLVMAQEEDARKAKEAELLEEKSAEKPVKKGPQPGHFIEWIKEQRQLQQEALIRETVIARKQLDTKELEKRRKPLQKLEEENERKKKKQRQRLKEGENIFHETVAALFPDVMKEKPPPPPDPYRVEDDLQIGQYYQYYEALSEEADQFVADNPYRYDFDWRAILSGGRWRRQKLFDSYRDSRSKRRWVRAGAESSKELPITTFEDNVEEEGATEVNRGVPAETTTAAEGGEETREGEGGGEN